MADDAHLWLGRRADGGAVELPGAALVRHVMALGASGSGKTVFCKVVVEEAVRRGIPAICVDPQGDLASFAAGMASDEELEARGVDPVLADQLAGRAEVVIFTPGSARGVPLCADPIDPLLADRPDRAAAVGRTASMVAGLLGFDLDADDGAGMTAVIDRLLHALLEEGAHPTLALLSERLTAAAGDASFARYLDARKIRVACQRAARLDVGARRALFHDGVPIDVDTMLAATPGRTRIAVVYLNTLHAQEDKEFFVAALAERIYSWMLEHPSEAPQLLFYVDEIAPFIPPVRKPASKEALGLVFKQARKYGVCCLMATQNPGDVDYRAMAQFGTWALGRLTTRQDLKKVEPTIKALAPDSSDSILGRLPALSPGQLILLSPDALGAPVEVRTRWLLTKHETWNEERIAAYSEAHVPSRAPSPAPEPEAPPATPSPPPAARERGSTDREVLAALADRPSMNARELAHAIDRHEATVRRSLERLVSAGEVRAFSGGRSRRYCSAGKGGRPDLGLPPIVDVLALHLSRADVEQLALEHARTKLLGVIGEDETFERAELAHRLAYRVAFEERVERSILARVFGPTHDERVGSVYLHPHNLGVILFSNARGIRFDDLPAGPASDIADFDGAATIDRVDPALLALDDDDVLERKSEAVVRAHFQKRFDAEPGAIDPIFVPLWDLYFLRPDGKGHRRVTIDGLVGLPVRWLPP